MKNAIFCAAVLAVSQASVCANTAKNAVISSSLEWLKDPSKPMPANLDALVYQNKQVADNAREELIKIYRQYALAQGWDKDLPALDSVTKQDMSPQNMTADNQKMPYVLVAKGTAGKNGWPLVIAMHGGGIDPRGTINDREWDAQKQFFKTFYPAGMYFIPRMANDQHGRWWYDYCQKIYADVIKKAIWTRGVDADRVYVTGISEGGYAAFRLPCFTPERFAAASAMAASEPFDTSPPQNLHSVAFRCDIGEKDTMFGRDKLALNYKAKLAELNKQSPQQYKHEISIQPGRGHGIDYRPGPLWMIENVRQTRPSSLVWQVNTMHNSFYNWHYWLGFSQQPANLPLNIKASIKDNVVDISCSDKDNRPVEDLPLRLYLDDQLVNLDAAVTVMLNGKQVHNGKLPRKFANQLRSLSERSDPGFIFPVILDLKK